jgi:hypothetical protein
MRRSRRARPSTTTTTHSRSRSDGMRCPLALLIVSLLLGLMAPASARAGKTSRAPLLRAHGNALRWTAAGHHNRYKLLIRAPGFRRVVTLNGRVFVPHPMAGTKVIYRVKAAGNESPWSNPVTIVYPRHREEGHPPRVEGTPHPEEPGHGEPPAEPRREGSGVGLGAARYRLDAAQYFDPFATSTYVPWVHSHITLIKGYPPFADIYASTFGMPVLGYHDPATEGHAPLEAGGVQTVVGEVQRDMSNGYRGVYIDDANWSPGFTPSPGPRANLANLIEAIHATEPGSVIEVNSHFHDIWPLVQSGDPDVARALRYIAMVCVEFGVGPTSGINDSQEYLEFLRYADAMHAKGVHLTLTGDKNANNVPTMEYNLATYMLLNDGGDYVTGTELTPATWWSGFDVNIGEALGPREREPSGLWTRPFSGGVVYTVEPGAATQTINLGRTMHSAEWGDVTSLTLAGGQGAVLAG